MTGVPGPGGIEFAYHRSLAPMMWAFFGLAVTELVVVHFVLILLVDWRIALAISLLSLSSILWIAAVIRSFRRMPVRIEDGSVTMRAGRLRTIRFPLADIARARGHFAAAELKRPGTVNLALIAYPNVLIELATPLVGRRRPVTAIAHRLDDPAAFFAALNPSGA